MSTRAQIAIQTGPKEWTHIYCHFDGYPGIPTGLPYLTGWVQHFAVVATTQDAE
jgi:hypothetical protein